MKKGKIIEGIEITDWMSDGKGFARLESGQVIFVDKAFPGDIVNAKVTKKKKDFLEAKITEFVQKSPDRKEAFCDYYGTCGGCKLQDVDYNKQLEYKQKVVVDAFKRIAKVEVPEVRTIMGSAKTTEFRNKLEYTYTAEEYVKDPSLLKGDDFYEKPPALGFHVPGRFDWVIDVEKCFLQKEPSNLIRNASRVNALENDYAFYNMRSNVGFLRNLTIRTTEFGESMVILSASSTSHGNKAACITDIETHLNHLINQFPDVTSWNYVVNDKGNDTIFDLDIVNHNGKDHIIEELDGLKFKIQPKSFFQTNTDGALKLYRTAKEFADLKGDEMVFDLYCGTGSISNYIANDAGSVVGIELIEDAIKDAKINSEMNKIDNTHFYAGDVKDYFVDETFGKHGKPEVLITNPARAGMHADVIGSILKIDPKRIVYVSCNAATQARDVQLLSEKYHVTKMQTVDLFPHTAHVENVILMERN